MCLASPTSARSKRRDTDLAALWAVQGTDLAFPLAMVAAVQLSELPCFSESQLRARSWVLLLLFVEQRRARKEGALEFFWEFPVSIQVVSLPALEAHNMTPPKSSEGSGDFLGISEA